MKERAQPERRFPMSLVVDRKVGCGELMIWHKILRDFILQVGRGGGGCCAWIANEAKKMRKAQCRNCMFGSSATTDRKTSD